MISSVFNTKSISNVIFNNKHKILMTGVAGVLATAIAGQAFAQQTKVRKFGPDQNSRPITVEPPRQQAGPKPVIVSRHGKWVVQCDALPKTATAEQKKNRGCAVIQIAQSTKQKGVGVSLIIGKLKQGKKTATMMRVMAPIGVFLPTGIALEIDGQAVGRVPFTRCLPQTCMAFAEARKETLAKMRKGKKGNFIIYQAPGVGIPLKLDLAGFTAAMKSLDKAMGAQ